jgi:hypothetical protein
MSLPPVCGFTIFPRSSHMRQSESVLRYCALQLDAIKVSSERFNSFQKAADGALGAHTYAVTDAYHDFKEMAKKIAAGAGIGEMS